MSTRAPQPAPQVWGEFSDALTYVPGEFGPITEGLPAYGLTERAWELVDPVLASPPPLHAYPPGWGPEEAERLIEPRRWYLPD